MKSFFVIVFFPITIIFFVTKFILKKIQLIRLDRYISTITLTRIDSLSGEEFEDFMYYLLCSMGFSVSKTKKSHDYGADLIVSSKSKKIVIQCKLYTKHSVGNSAVQEIYTATNYYNAQLGLVVTNSFFSKPAISLAESSGILLWNRNMLQNIIQLSRNDKKLLKDSLLSI